MSLTYATKSSIVFLSSIRVEQFHFDRSAMWTIFDRKCFHSQEVVYTMAYSKQQAHDAAKKLPKNRTSKEQAIVDEAKKNDKTVRNLDYEAARTQRYGG